MPLPSRGSLPTRPARVRRRCSLQPPKPGISVPQPRSCLQGVPPTVVAAQSAAIRPSFAVPERGADSLLDQRRSVREMFVPSAWARAASSAASSAGTRAVDKTVPLGG